MTSYSTTFIVLTSLLFTANVYAMQGSGTSTDPYQIKNCQDLQNIQQDLTANYVLANDIDCSDTKNWNDGQGFAPIRYSSGFQGTLDGQNHVVSNLYINRPNDHEIGLFGYTQNAVIANVGLVNVDITGAYLVGGLVGNLYVPDGGASSIKNCYVTGTVRGFNPDSTRTNLYVGALVAFDDGGATITDSYATGTVEAKGNQWVGGLIGFYYGGSLENVYFNGVVKSDQSQMGGLAGYAGYGNITNASSAGNVISSGYDVGGLIGDAEVDTITNSYSTATVQGSDAVGGLIGYMQNTRISQCDAGGDVYATSSSWGAAGGLIGEADAGNNIINNSYATGAVSTAGGAGAGGLVGYLYGYVSTSYATGRVTAGQTPAATGGLVGGTGGQSNPVTDSYYDADISGQSDTGKGTPKSDLEMKQQATFAGWDFATIWQMDEGISYPTLRGF